MFICPAGSRDSLVGYIAACVMLGAGADENNHMLMVVVVVVVVVVMVVV
jgi:hypothetical protein